MSDLITPDYYPFVNVESLEVPKAGELARASELREALAQLLNNDAALLKMMPAKLSVTRYQLFFPNTGEELLRIRPGFPSVGAMIGVEGGPIRVAAYTDRDGPSVKRGYFEPPEAYDGCIFDASLGDYAGSVMFDRPLLYAHNDQAMTFTASLNNPDEYNEQGYFAFVTVLAFADWPRQFQET